MQKVEMIESRGHSGNSECPTECSAELRNAFCFCFFIKSSSSKKQTSTLQKFFFPKKVRGFITWVGGGAKREEIFEKL